MEHSEKILDDVQDAVFFLLLDGLSEYQGKTYQKINKGLQSEPTATVPYEVTATCQQTIRKTFQITNRKHRYRTATNLFKKIAIIVTIMILLITGAFAALPSFRTNTLNWVLDLMDDRMTLQFLQESESIASWNMLWLPEGYTCSSVSDHNNVFTFESSENPEENWIVMTVVPREESRISVDTEDAEVVEELEIRGFQSVFIEEDGFTTLVWNYTDTDYVISLFASKLQKDELCKIAENIYPAEP